MLHLLSHSPSDPRFELCIRSMLTQTVTLNNATLNTVTTYAVKTISQLVLYQDAVYVLADGYQHSGFYALLSKAQNISATSTSSSNADNNHKIAIYALVDDLILRGMQLDTKQVKLNANQPITAISYPELVELTLVHHPILNW